MKNSKRVMIHPFLPNVIVGVLLAGIGAWMVQYDRTADAHRGRFDFISPVIAVFGILIVLNSLLHCSMHEKGITIHFLWVPIYRIKWNRITEVRCIQAWQADPDGAKFSGNLLYFIVDNCVVFAPEIDGWLYFKLRHPLKAHFIRFSKRKKEKVIEAVQQWYPNAHV